MGSILCRNCELVYTHERISSVCDQNCASSPSLRAENGCTLSDSECEGGLTVRPSNKTGDHRREVQCVNIAIRTDL